MNVSVSETNKCIDSFKGLETIEKEIIPKIIISEIVVNTDGSICNVGLETTEKDIIPKS